MYKKHTQNDHNVKKHTQNDHNGKNRLGLLQNKKAFANTIKTNRISQ